MATGAATTAKRMASFIDRHPRVRPLGVVIAVQQRFRELEGRYLAAAVTLMAFLAMFPLVVVAIAALGFVSVSGRDVADALIRALGFPAGGDAAAQVRDVVRTAEDSRQAATLVGLIGLAWSGLGVVGSLEHAYNAVWQVTGRGLRDKGIGMLWLVGAGVLFLASLALTGAIALLPMPALAAALGAPVGVGISFALWLSAARVLPNRAVAWRAVVPGAIVGALGLEALKLAGAIYVPRALGSASSLYGSVGLVFALLAWLYFFGRLVVYSAVLDVVLYERRRGTTEAEIEVPRLAGGGAEATNRAGRVEVA